MNDGSRYEVVLRHLTHLVEAATPGAPLPSTRSLSRTLGASPVTIGRAISAMASRGLVHTEPGRGTFVTRATQTRSADVGWQPMALPPASVALGSVEPLDPAHGDPGLVPLSSGYLGADLQPRQALQAAASRTVRRQEIWSPAPAAGLTELRAVFAAQIGVDSDQVIVTQGSQSGLALALRALGTPGDAIAVENPTYPGALAAARAAGLRPVAVPMDRHGIRPDDLDRVLARSQARLVYLQTAVNNPAGVTLSPDRRQEILAVAADHQVLLIDDDWARFLPLDRPVAPPLIADDLGGHVVHLSSLAKPVAPSLRIGFLAATGPALVRLRTATITDALFVARPMQEIALELLTSPQWPQHLKRMRRVLVARRDHLLAEVARTWPSPDPSTTRPTAGYHLWVRCPDPLTSGEVTQRARAAGIVVLDGALAFADEPPTQHVRMSFGAINEVAATAALQTLAAALRS